MFNFEASGDLADWPPNVKGKPTQVAVFGTEHTSRGKCCEILWTGKFPELDKAIYWGAKKELEAIRKGGFVMANRIIWQHELTPEEAVATVYRQIKKQVASVVRAVKKGEDPDAALRSAPQGPMKPIDYSKVREYLVEIETPDDQPSGGEMDEGN